jgi:hypothetical protein
MVRRAFTWASRLGDLRHRRALRSSALATAVVLHLLLLLLVVPGTSGAALDLGQGAGNGPERTIVVSMSGLSGVQFPFVRHMQPPDQSKDDPMKALFKRLSTDDPSAIPVSDKQTRSSSSNLLDAFNPAPDGPVRPNHQNQAAKAGDGGDGGNAGAAHGAQAAPTKVVQVGGGDGAPSRGSFSRQVNYCWRRLPGRSAVPVTLQVTLNPQGQIAKPPVIERPATAVLNEARLMAEDRAIRALAGCVPYKGVTGGGQTFKLDFATSR